MKSKIHWIHSAVVILLPLYHIKLFPVYLVAGIGGKAALVELVAAAVAAAATGDVAAATGDVAAAAAAVAASAPVVLIAS